MKEGIHPKYHDIEARCACGATWPTRSTKPELHLEICNNCHPFFTGRQKLIDTEGRVERFTKRFGVQTSDARTAAAKARYFAISRASAREVAAALDLAAIQLGSRADLAVIAGLVREIDAMLVVYRERLYRELAQRRQQRTAAAETSLLDLEQAPPAVRRLVIPAVAAQPQPEPVDRFQYDVEMR